MSPQTASAIRGTVAAGERTASDVVHDCFACADSVGVGADGLNLVLARDDEIGRRVDDDAKRSLADRPEARLLGVPVAVKDNIATTRMPTTCASRILSGYHSPFEATAIARLRADGASIVAKTNMDEFGMGSSTENSGYGPARNPLAPDRVPGGSSGGSAGVVAAGMVPIALGSETGGSVRQPAAFCGVVGVKPTYGRVSRFGLVAFGSSLDQIGVFGRSVADAALGLEVIAGHDPLDSTSSEVPPSPYVATGEESVAGMVVGLPREFFPDDLDPAIKAACDRAVEKLRALGAVVRDVSLPHTSLAVPVYYVIAPAEASSNLARFDGVRFGRRGSGDALAAMYESTRSEGFGPEVIRRILLGTYVLSAGYYDAYYRKAQRVRGLIARDCASVFASGVDVLFTPTTPTPAFRLGEIASPYEMYLSDVFTVTANLAGIPAMSLPIGRSGGLPIGGQLMAPHFEESRMFAAAFALERALGAEAHR